MILFIISNLIFYTIYVYTTNETTNTKDGQREKSDARPMKRSRASSSDTADVSLLLLFLLIHVVRKSNYKTSI